MSAAWRRRLEKAIARSGRSEREISLGAGLGHGYVHTILKKNVEPTLAKFIAIANELEVSLAWLLLGVEMGPDVEELLKLLDKLPERRKEAFLELLRESAESAPDGD